MAETWAAIGIGFAYVLGMLFYLGPKIDRLGARIDAVGTHIDEHARRRAR